MSLAEHRFAKEIVYDILRQYPLEVGQLALENDGPGLYGLYGKRIVEKNLSLYKERISKYYTKDYYEIFDEDTFNKIANAIINNSGKRCQRFEDFYIMCLQLGLLCAVALEKGYADAVSCAVNRIESLAKISYLSHILDERFDLIFNFAYEVLNCCFKCYGKEAKLGRLKKVDVDPNVLDYFAWNEHDIIELHKQFEQRRFDFRIKNELFKKYVTLKGFASIISLWISDKGGERIWNREKFLRLLILISVYSCIVEPLNLNFILFAHETIVKLSIIAARFGIIYCS